jgi:hypothetical protein
MSMYIYIYIMGTFWDRMGYVFLKKIWDGRVWKWEIYYQQTTIWRGKMMINPQIVSQIRAYPLFRQKENLAVAVFLWYLSRSQWEQ